MALDTTAKWNCPTCTYLNWSSSNKCVLCGSNKPVNNGPPKSTIAKMKQTTQSSLTIKQSPNTGEPATVSWTCSECTYINWSNSSLCTVCNSSKKTPPTKSRRSDLIMMGGASEATPLDRSRRTNKRTSSPPAKKWICPSCTYENWPRSVKCIMCLTPMGGVSDDIDDTCDTCITSLSCNKDVSGTRVRQIRNRFNLLDWLYLDACRGVINNDISAIKGYLKQGGERSRQLTQDELLVLNEPSKYTVGSTLVHLAVRFHKSDILSYLLTPAPVEARKRLPSHTNIELATNIRELIRTSLQTGAGICHYINQLTTFILPQEINDLKPSVLQKLFEEIIDLDVQKELQEEAPIINWSNDLIDSRLYPLWNRTAGDCLLDSVLQATWGVVDRDSTLRQALSNSLINGSLKFYERWRQSELAHAHAQEFNIEEDQLKSDWSLIISSAIKQGQPLEQIHIFVLAHILRRPLIVYGVKVVKNYKGEQLGLANFEGIYLPLLWDTSFCWRVPIALGYTRGHFSALIGTKTSSTDTVIHLPLVDSQLKPLPVHFISEHESDCHEDLVKEYCDCHVTSSGVLTAQQIFTPSQQPSQLTSLLQEWMDRFFKLNKTYDIL